MSYSNEQYQKHSEYVDQQLSDYSHEKRAEIKQLLLNTWPDDAELKQLVIDKKKEYDMEASPEEIDEAFKNFRI